jgi:hypothetical protein
MEEFSNPFEEEFELTDVINKTEISTGISQKTIKERPRSGSVLKDLSEEDLDKIVHYDQERRKRKSFQSQLNEDVELSDQELILENEFKDFLIAPKITGSGNLKGKDHIYPKSKVKVTDKKVEITSAPPEKSHKHGKASVLINRDDKGDLENIEIVCDCGENILLKFEVVDNLNQNLTTIVKEDASNPKPFNQESTTAIKEHKDENEIPLIEDGDLLLEDKPESIESTEKESITSEAEEEWFDDFSDSDEDVDMGDVDLSGI